jgi:hypothetical protein
MLKFSKISFFKETKFCEGENRESVGILQNVSLLQHAIFKFYLIIRQTCVEAALVVLLL